MLLPPLGLGPRAPGTSQPRKPSLQATQALHKVFTSFTYPEVRLVISSHILTVLVPPIFVHKGAHRKESRIPC